MANTPVPTPDFDTIRQSLVAFLSSQNTLIDYDFEGSTMSTILDLLSYNTFINAFYLNMAANESFLSTAIKRDSVVAKAVELGYTPKSAKSAQAIVNLTITSSSGAPYVIIPANTLFLASDGVNSYTFRTYVSYTAALISPGVYGVNNVTIYEGKQLTQLFNVDGVSVINSVSLPNPNIDTSILRVYVSDVSNSNSFSEYNYTNDITTNGPTSLIYYLEETDGGLYNIYFGDDYLSKALVTGTTVKVSYIITKADAANGLNAFSYSSGISDPSAVVTVTTVGSASGGGPAESIDSIKFRAPKTYETQNRAVTAADYPILVKNLSNNVSDVIAKGGQDVYPPLYNTVVLYIKPVTGTYLSTAEKRALATAISAYTTILTQPVILDPEYLYLNVYTTIDYNALKTPLLEDNLKLEITDQILAYSNIYLGKFAQDFRNSVFGTYVDNIDISIVSNFTQIQLEKRIVINTQAQSQYQLLYSTSVKPGTLSSSSFTYKGFSNAYFTDDGNGLIKISVQQINATILDLETNIGTINYTTGQINIASVFIPAIPQTPEFFNSDLGNYFIKFYMQSIGKDINTSNDQILQINTANVTMNKTVGY